MSRLGRLLLEVARKSDEWMANDEGRALNVEKDIQLRCVSLTLPSIIFLPFVRIYLDRAGAGVYLGKIDSFRIRVALRRTLRRIYKRNAKEREETSYRELCNKLFGVEADNGQKS